MQTGDGIHKEGVSSYIRQRQFKPNLKSPSHVYLRFFGRDQIFSCIYQVIYAKRDSCIMTVNQTDSSLAVMCAAGAWWRTTDTEDDEEVAFFFFSSFLNWLGKHQRGQSEQEHDVKSHPEASTDRTQMHQKHQWTERHFPPAAQVEQDF